MCNRNEVIRDETGVIRSHRDEGRGAVSFTANNQEDRIRSFFGECTQVEGSAFGRYMASFNVTFDRPRFRHTQPRLETDGHREVFRITGYHVQIDGNGSLSECIYQGASQESCMHEFEENREYREWATDIAAVLSSSSNDCK
ncbi:MAG: hypothetical protein MJK18_12695 [Bdellovibrionales bacterium]|nr:hypothetical protein [Bdellovibrionales bacterium]